MKDIFLKKLSLFFGLFLFCFFSTTNLAFAIEATSSAEEIENLVVVHLFSSKTCPHCKKEKEFLSTLVNQDQQVKVVEYEISTGDNDRILALVAERLETRSGGVPLTVIGDKYLIGFSSADTTGLEILDLIENKKNSLDKSDVVSQTIAKSNIVPVISSVDSVNVEDSLIADKPVNEGKKVAVPILGELNLSDLSLPIVSIILGLLDGFNPCAMWTLIFLISLLIGIGDRKRMLLLGSAFILVSGGVYFLFLTSWLNLFLFIGLITWIRLLIGLVALGTGGYYLWDFVKNKSGACKVEAGGKKQQVFTRLKEITQKQSLLVALGGIVLLAVAVNAVELMCSAGLPAVFTQLLTINNSPVSHYYFYMLIYITFFMLDDLVLFIVAIVTLKSIGLDTKYARYSHLIGGILMLAIGLAMLFKPELLTFS